MAGFFKIKLKIPDFAPGYASKIATRIRSAGVADQASLKCRNKPTCI